MKLKEKAVRRHLLRPGDTNANSATIGLGAEGFAGANTAMDKTPGEKAEGEEGSVPQEDPEKITRRHIRVPVSQKTRLASRRSSLASQSSSLKAGSSEIPEGAQNQTGMLNLLVAWGY